MRFLARVVSEERGFVLPLVLILLLFGLVLVIPFLDFARLRFGDLQESIQLEEKWFAADAGIEAVIADLRLGSDVLDGGYVIPAVELNDYTPSISISTPPRDAMVPFGAVFVDPETATSLNPVPANSDFLYVVDHVQTFADFQISWVYTPEGVNWDVAVFEGVGTGGSKVFDKDGSGSPVRVNVDREDIVGGSYTIRFTNKSNSQDITSAPFSPFGSPDNTWVRVNAFKDYVITSTVDDITLVAFARQGPGPNQVVSTVHVTTWDGPI